MTSLSMSRSTSGTTMGGEVNQPQAEAGISPARGRDLAVEGRQSRSRSLPCEQLCGVSPRVDELPAEIDIVADAHHCGRQRRGLVGTSTASSPHTYLTDAERTATTGVPAAIASSGGNPNPWSPPNQRHHGQAERN